MKMRVDIAKIKPVGAIAIVVLSAVGIFMSFTVDLGVPERYTPRHDTAYYTQNAEAMAELLLEVQTDVLPRLDGVTDCYIAADGTRIVVEAEPGELDKVKAVLERDFGEGLFVVIAFLGSE